jgi:hypothetical protein
VNSWKGDNNVSAVSQETYDWVMNNSLTLVEHLEAEATSTKEKQTTKINFLISVFKFLSFLEVDEADDRSKVRCTFRDTLFLYSTIS